MAIPTPRGGYQIRDIKTPVLSHKALDFFVSCVESVDLLPRLLMNTNAMFSLRLQQWPDAPAFLPLASEGAVLAENQKQRGAKEPAWSEIKAEHVQDVFPSVWDFHRAYLERKTSPKEVVERVLSNIAHSQEGSEPLNAFIGIDEVGLRKAAEASAARYAAGQARSPLDGVPVAVKAEFHVQALRANAGTSFLRFPDDQEEATIVSRLRQAGALIVGITNMHEIGIGVTGSNVHHGVTRNPYDRARHTGGSSSGSAAAVAAGLIPLAIGTDGGGSIRIPASLCGLVGLKPSFGRWSSYGTFPSAPTVAQSGPMGTSARDCALVYRLLSGPDPKDPFTYHQPEPSLRDWNRTQDLSDLVVGLYRPWFEHAEADIVRLCYAGIEALKARGLRVIEIEIPELEEVRIAHFHTIASEMNSFMQPHLPKNRDQLSPTTRFALAMASQATAHDYIQAQRIRARAIKHLESIFARVSYVVSPVTAVVAPLIRDGGLTPEALDHQLMGRIMRFSQLHNFTGIPSVTFPVGYTDAGLPVGIQFAARWWAEADLLRVARAAEGLLPKKRPNLYYDPLRV